MRTIQQQSTLERAKYLRRAANYARKRFRYLLDSPEYRHAHDSHALAQALRDTETKYADLGTFGPEYIPQGHNRRSPAITYLNTGDCYEATILVIRGRFYVGCWGYIVERGNYS